MSELIELWGGPLGLEMLPVEMRVPREIAARGYIDFPLPASGRAYTAESEPKLELPRSVRYVRASPGTRVFVPDQEPGRTHARQRAVEHALRDLRVEPAGDEL